MQVTIVTGPGPNQWMVQMPGVTILQKLGTVKWRQSLQFQGEIQRIYSSPKAG